MKTTTDKKTIFYILKALNKALVILIEMNIIDGQEQIMFLIEKYNSIGEQGILLSEIDNDYTYLNTLFNSIYND